MFEASIQRRVRASHALMLRGEREPTHWHDWKIELVVAGDTLDEDGLLVDFHALEQSLERIIGEWDGAHLNDVLPSQFGNASAEQVAGFVAIAMSASMPAGVTLRRVSVTEAPNCVATWIA